MHTTAERARTHIETLATTGLDIDTFGTAAMEILNRAVPMSTACLATADPATELVTGGVKWGGLDDERDQEWAFYEYEGPDDDNFQSVVGRPGGVTSVFVETGGHPERSHRIAEFLRPGWDVEDEMRAALCAEGSTWGFLALFREGRGANFTPAEQAFVSGIRVAFATGLRAGLLVAAAIELVPVIDGPAVLVIGADGEIAQASVGAAARVADLGGGPLGDSPLPLAVGTLVSAAREFAVGRYPVVPRLRLKSRSGQWVVAHASPLLSRDGSSTDVVITIDEARTPEIVPLVVAAFGLTRREQDVVALVLRGVDTGEVARTLHLSNYTVQDHLKSIFNKVGVRSRRELTARVFYDQYAPRLAAGNGLAPSGWFAGSGPLTG